MWETKDRFFFLCAMESKLLENSDGGLPQIWCIMWERTLMVVKFTWVSSSGNLYRSLGVLVQEIVPVVVMISTVFKFITIFKALPEWRNKLPSPKIIIPSKG
jgi:hypothetical protein